MKRSILLMGIVMILTSLLVHSTLALAIEAKKFRFSTGYPPPPDLTAVDHVWFFDEITKRTGGKVTFDLIWGGALGKPLEHIDMVKKGVVDLARVPLLFHGDRVPLWGYEFAFPFPPSDPEIIARVWWKLLDEFPAIQDQLKKENQIAVATTIIDDYNLISRVPLKTLADLKGKVVGASGIYFPKQLEAAGAKGHISPMGERYLLLKLGTIDASHAPIDYFVSYKKYEVAKHVLMINGGSWVSGAITMNLDVWNKLSAELQKVFMEVGKEASFVHAKRLKTEREAGIKLIKDQGGAVNILSVEDRKKWMAAMADTPGAVVKSLEAKGLPAGKVLKRWYDETKMAGHEWFYKPTW